MVQVDVVWSYAFGASFAAAASHQLATQEKAFENKFYVNLLVYLSVFFAPSGLFLLWAFPHWETMQVARSADDIPAWLVTLFGITNITQGILGYYVGYRFARGGRHEWAHLNWLWSWILFWFILCCGWDTTGWQRFLYDRTLHGGELWQPGRHDGLGFFLGNVWMSLVVMGALFAPALIRGIVDTNYRDLRSKSNLSAINFREFLVLGCIWFGSFFGITLLLAMIISFAVRAAVALTGHMLIGYVLGLGVMVPLVHWLLIRRDRPLGRLLARLHSIE